MSSPAKSKYIVTGNLKGKFKATYERLAALFEKHGAFSGWFCTGDLICPTMTHSDREFLKCILTGSVIPSLSIYFVANEHANQDEEICRLIADYKGEQAKFWTNTSGAAVLPDGIRIAYVSGGERADGRKSDHLGGFGQADCDKILGPVDLLFSFDFPRGITEHSLVAPSGLAEGVAGSKCLADLAARICPRYHFAIAEDIFYEREPYENTHKPASSVFTRFISLASVGEQGAKGTKRWSYAINIAASDKDVDTVVRPPNTTISPYAGFGGRPSTLDVTPNYFFQIDAGQKRPFANTESEALAASKIQPMATKKPPPGYICKRCRSSAHYYRDCAYRASASAAEEAYICHYCHEPGHPIHSCPKRLANRANSDDRTTQAPPIDPEGCWFCLANPSVQKHLLVWIGEEVYITIAKGGLTSWHLLLIPIEHLATVALIPELVAAELEKARTAVASMFEKHGLVPVFWKLRHNPRHHWHEQLVGIQADKLDRFVEFAREYGDKHGFAFAPAACDEPTLEPSFQVRVQDKILLHRMDQAAFFPVQFGRQLVSDFLGIADGGDWKASATSTMSVEEEARLARDIKNEFINYV